MTKRTCKCGYATTRKSSYTAHVGTCRKLIILDQRSVLKQQSSEIERLKSKCIENEASLKQKDEKIKELTMELTVHKRVVSSVMSGWSDNVGGADY